MYPIEDVSFTFSRLTQVDLFVKLPELIINCIIKGLDCITLFISAFDSKYISEKLHPSNGTIPPIYMEPSCSVNILSPREFLKLYIRIIIGRRAYSSTESFRLDIPRLNDLFSQMPISSLTSHVLLPFCISKRGARANRPLAPFFRFRTWDSQ